MKTYKYIAVANKLLDYIRTNKYFHGRRLPSVSALAEEFKVSRETVIAALHELSDSKIIEIRSRDGSYVTPHAWDALYKGTPDWPHIMENGLYGDFHPEAAEVPKHYYKRLISDEFGHRKYIASAIQKTANMVIEDCAFMKNITVSGLPALKDTVRHYLKKYKNIDCKPEQIIITSNGIAMSTVLQALVNSTTPVCMPCPNPASVTHTKNIYKMKLIQFQEGDLAAFRKIAEEHKRLIYMGTTVSRYPSGCTFSKEYLEELMQIAISRKIPLVEFDYQSGFNSNPVTLKSMDNYGIVIYMGSLTNILTVGAGVSWLVVHDELISQFEELVEMNGGSSQVIEQLIVNNLLQENVLTEYLPKAQNIFRGKVELVKELLTEHLRDYAEWVPENIGHFAWIKMKKKEYILALQATNEFSFTPGYLFGESYINYFLIFPCNSTNADLVNIFTSIGNICHQIEKKKIH